VCVCVCVCVCVIMSNSSPSIVIKTNDEGNISHYAMGIYEQQLFVKIFTSSSSFCDALVFVLIVV
jgi:hypothetical protein